MNSIRPGMDANAGNIGHPSQPHEIDWFLTMLAKAAPQMTPKEKATLENWLRGQKRAESSQVPATTAS